MRTAGPLRRGAVETGAACGAWTAGATFTCRLCFVETPYCPTLTCRFDGDTIEVWLIPASLLMGEPRTVGGERGYVFTPDGKQLIREMDSFTSYRSIVAPDSGQVRIVSSEATVPTT